MRQDGFYNSMIALIVLALAASMLFIQATAIKTTQTQTNQRAIFDLKWSMQNMQYLLDKAAADAMADCYNRDNCGIITECGTTGAENYSAKISSYLGEITRDASENFGGVQCDPINVPDPVSDGADFQFNLKCSKTIGRGFDVEFTKSITLNKTVNTEMSESLCTIKVIDNQSNSCDVVEPVGATCP